MLGFNLKMFQWFLIIWASGGKELIKVFYEGNCLAKKQRVIIYIYIYIYIYICVCVYSYIHISTES